MGLDRSARQSQVKSGRVASHTTGQRAGIGTKVTGERRHVGIRACARTESRIPGAVEAAVAGAGAGAGCSSSVAVCVAALTDVMADVVWHVLCKPSVCPSALGSRQQPAAAAAARSRRDGDADDIWDGRGSCELAAGGRTGRVGRGKERRLRRAERAGYVDGGKGVTKGAQSIRARPRW